MEHTFSQALEKMLSVLRKEGPERGDYLPGSNGEYYQLGEPESELEPGLSLRALETLKSKLDSGCSLNDLEAFGANVLSIMAHQLDWRDMPPRPAPPVYQVSQHTAVISGSYTVAGSLRRFAAGLEVELVSAGYARLLGKRVISCEVKEGAPGLQIVEVEVMLTFQVKRAEGADQPLEAILKGIEACITHPNEALAPVPRMLKSITTFVA